MGDNPSSFALQQLERLRPSYSANALAHALAVVDVLSSEELGQQFFTTFKATLERMAASIESRKSADDRRMVALLALSRILFLYFVQEKGWLDGRRDYLKDRLDTTLARQRSFHRSILHPLFFGTLNQPPALRKKNVRLGAIPYLNGGLFEEDDLDRDPDCTANLYYRAPRLRKSCISRLVRTMERLQVPEEHYRRLGLLESARA